MSKPASVLLVSVDADVITTVRDVVALVAGCSCVAVERIDQALHILADSPATLCIYHATQSSQESLDWLLRDLAAGTRSEATLVITDDVGPEGLLRFLEPGVADCLSRPLDRSRLRFLVDSLTFRARNVFAPAAKSTQTDSLAVDSDVGFGEPGTSRLTQIVHRVARQDSTVLLSGETGVGKTRLARVIHELSPRQKAPFMAVNCAALPESLLESELFGHCKGSFTGADATRTGRFAAAGSGTLFLDEVDSLPLALQKKLLRAVDERVFEPVGSNQSQPLKARLIVATNRNLVADIGAGSFRSDLYYRLSVIELNVPPLRMRRHAIIDIAESYLAECAGRNDRRVPRVSPEVWNVLLAYDWPGNIRELRNTMERALALCDNHAIVLDDLPEAVRASAGTRPIVTAINQSEPSGTYSVCTSLASSEAAAVDRIRRIDEASESSQSTLAKARADGEISRIILALRRSGNNRTRAAAELGISRVAFYKKLRRFCLLDFSEFTSDDNSEMATNT